ncbi:hypothetical protein BY996DRAFT_8270594 [Phakopsora pachyrhizi]|nr:hypothetical protein BY996DRAFT_8270594 [Phakopsora pachyrhizi]
MASNSDSRTIVDVVYAIHDFQAENPDELSFIAGESIHVTEKDDQYGDGWWQGRNARGDFGLFPQAYTLPNQPNNSSDQPGETRPSQPTMNETLSEVQNAIDQLHHPSSSTLSLAAPLDSVTSSQSPSQGKLSGPGYDGNRTFGSRLEPDPGGSDSNPPATGTTKAAQARALLALKAKADAHASSSLVLQRLKPTSNQVYSDLRRQSYNSTISIPDVGEMELSEESGDESDTKQSGGSPFSNRQRTRRSGDPPFSGSTLASQAFLHRSKTPPPSSKLKLDGPVNAAPSLSSGPFASAAIALGIAQSHRPDSNNFSTFRRGSQPEAGTFKKTHQSKPASSSSILSDFGMDLRERLSFGNSPVASALRMNRESSQPPQILSSATGIDRLQRMSADGSGELDLHANSQTAAVYSLTAAHRDSEESSPQEFLAPAFRPSSSHANSGLTKPLSHQRQRSASSTTSGIFFRQQNSSPIPPQPSTAPLNGPSIVPTSTSTTDSSSMKGSRSRSSSRVERYPTAEDQPTSPATSTFPSLSGLKTGGDSISSSLGALNKSSPCGIKSTTDPAEWSVSDVVEWGRAKALDDFTLGKFVEHEITGDVLLELDVNSLKEIDLAAFGRRVRVTKAIDELKKIIHGSKQLFSPHTDFTFCAPPGSEPPLSASAISPCQSSFKTHTNTGPQHRRDHSVVSASAHQRQEMKQIGSSYREAAGDSEEELGNKSSPHPQTARSSILGHSNRPSEGSALSFKSGIKKDSQSDDHNTSANVSGSRLRPMTSSGENGQIVSKPFIAHHNRCKSLTGEASPGSMNSQASSWTPLSIPESAERGETHDSITEKPLENSPDAELLKISKASSKKKKNSSQNPISTGTSLLSKKSPGEGLGEPPSSPETPNRPNDVGSGKSRTSFLGNLRGRKPPPKIGSPSPISNSTPQQNDFDHRPSTSSGLNGTSTSRISRGLFHFGSHNSVQGQSQHQLHHLAPVSESKTLNSSPVLHNDKSDKAEKKEGESRTALEKIGSPDHMGWMRKRGEKYPTWKMRFFILKASNLYYLKSKNEVRIKGLIKLSGYKVVMDADVHPGRYGFRIIHDNGSAHAFSAEDSKLLRDWMKAVMKATIDRDWVAPVISSCNIRTISIREAQKIFPPPRPPSPTSRARAQKARLASRNPDVLTEKDAAVLMSMKSFQGTPVGYSRNNPASNDVEETGTAGVSPRSGGHSKGVVTLLISV